MPQGFMTIIVQWQEKHYGGRRLREMTRSGWVHLASVPGWPRATGPNPPPGGRRPSLGTTLLTSRGSAKRPSGMASSMGSRQGHPPLTPGWESPSACTGPRPRCRRPEGGDTVLGWRDLHGEFHLAKSIILLNVYANAILMLLNVVLHYKIVVILYNNIAMYYCYPYYKIGIGRN